MNKAKSIIVEIPILDSIDEMKVVNTFTEKQLWYVCAIAKAFEKTQSNWNSLREQLEIKLSEPYQLKGPKNERISQQIIQNVLDKMNELEGKEKE